MALAALPYPLFPTQARLPGARHALPDDAVVSSFPASAAHPPVDYSNLQHHIQLLGRAPGETLARLIIFAFTFLSPHKDHTNWLCIPPEKDAITQLSETELLMGTLYRVLGLAENASAEQIEFAHKTALDKLQSEDLDSEQAMNRLKVLKEAYSILGSPTRRDIYDAKLKAPREIHYEAVPSPSLPWKAIAFGAALLIASGGFIYKNQRDSRLRLEEATIQAQRVKAEADQAVAIAEAENARLEQMKKYEQTRSNMLRNIEQQQARSEGQRISYEQERYRQAQERLVSLQAQEKERQQQQARYEKLREEQMARSRVQQENAAMQRALSIPIARH